MYLFVLSPPCHGSTVLYKLLWTSPNISTFFGKSDWAGEGQFIPAAKQFFGEDWSSDVDWASVKKIWHETWDTSKPILCEKSPSNICRAKAMEEFFMQFGVVYFICLVRSPYGHEYPERWIKGAQYQRKNISGLKNVFRLKYEELVGDLPGTIERLLQFLPMLGQLDPNVTRVPGLNDRRRSLRIRDMSIDATPEHIRHASHKLRHHKDLLEFHGYKLLSVPDNI